MPRRTNDSSRSGTWSNDGFSASNAVSAGGRVDYRLPARPLREVTHPFGGFAFDPKVARPTRPTRSFALGRKSEEVHPRTRSLIELLAQPHDLGLPFAESLALRRDELLLPPHPFVHLRPFVSPQCE
jgi:hypothetical protein